MKQKKGRLIILFSIIFILCIIAGYCVYKYYVNNPDDTTATYSEEINLGDAPGVCSKPKSAAILSSCKNVNCSTKKSSGACNASPCCSWNACANITNCKTYSVNRSGQCVCSECKDHFELKNGGRTCMPKQQSVSVCCVKTKSGDFETKSGSAICSAAFSANTYVHSGECNLCSNIKISIPIKASPEPGITIKASSKPEDGLECEWTISAGSKKGKLTCGIGADCSTTLSGFTPCTKVNVNVSGPSSASGRVEIESKFSLEEEKKTLKAIDTIPKTAFDADFAGKSYYGNENNCVTNSDGTKNCLVHVRSNCGESYNYCCVDNGTLLTSSIATYMENQPTKSCPTNYALLANVSKEDCVIKNDLGSCDASDIPSPVQTGKAAVCEDSVSIKVDGGKQCTNTVNNEKTNFYEIACVKTINTNFDYGNDGKIDTVRTLYKGEGFAFGINVDTTVNCKYTFYDEVWKKAYNGVINKIKAIDNKLIEYVNKNDIKGWETYINNNILHKNGINDASELFRLWTISEELKNAVKAYNEYTPSDKYDENSKITITTSERGKKVSNTYELLKTINDEGSYQISNVSNRKLDVSGVTNPQNYILSSKTPRKVKLIPKRTCIDRSTGKITTIDGSKCPNNTIDGGNKIYTSLLTDAVENNNAYPIVIKVEGLGSNGSLVINDKCDLKIEASKYIYRPIDVENPFINSSWKKGKNWVNEKFDFTKVINANTWSDNTNRKIITLTAKEISAIKESNNRAWVDKNSPYMGLCNKQSEKLQDEITKKLCSLIK